MGGPPKRSPSGKRCDPTNSKPLPVSYLRVVQHADVVVYLVGGDAMLLQPGGDLGGRAAHRPGGDELVEQVVVLEAPVDGGEAVVVGQSASYQQRQRRPLVVAGHGDGHPRCRGPGTGNSLAERATAAGCRCAREPGR